MPSIADEIAKLHQLLVAGVLTNEEFAEAKRNLIAGMNGGSQSDATPPPAPAAATTVAISVPSPISAAVNQASASASSNSAPSSTTTIIDSNAFEISHIGVHDVAYKHITTILTNIRNNFSEPKFRRLRRSNPKLAEELFSSVAAERFLGSVGFVDVQEGDGNDYYVLPMAESSSSYSSTFSVDQQVRLVESGLEAIRQLSARDNNAALEAINASKLLRNVALDIRKESCRAAKRKFASSSNATGEDDEDNASSASATATLVSNPRPVNPLLARMPLFDAYLAALFLNDELNDGLAIDNVRKLITVEENALRALNAAAAVNTSQSAEFEGLRKFLRMPLANLAAAKLVLGQKGAAETLVEMGGWVLRVTPVGSTVVTDLWAPLEAPLGSTTDAENSPQTPTGASSGVPHDLVLGGAAVALGTAPPTDASHLQSLVAKTAATITFLKSVERLLVEQSRRASMAEREAAIASVKQEMQKSLAEERGRKRAAQRSLAILEGGAPSSPTTTDGSSTTAGGGLRIRTEDAIRILMGKDTKEDVMQRTADRMRAEQAAFAQRRQNPHQSNPNFVNVARSRLLQGSGFSLAPQGRTLGGSARNSAERAGSMRNDANPNDDNDTAAGGSVPFHSAAQALAAGGFAGANDFDSDWSDH